MLLLLAATILAGGCEEDNAVAPDVAVYEIVWSVAQNSFDAVIGEDIEISYAAVVLRDGVQVPNTPITITRINGASSIVDQFVTDSSGAIAEIWSCSILAATGNLELRAESNGVSRSATIAVNPYPLPARFVLTPPAVRYYLADGEALTTWFSGMALDDNGVAIARMPLRFGLRATGATVFGRVGGSLQTSAEGEFTYSFDNLGFAGRETLFVSTDFDQMDGRQLSIEVPIDYVNLSQYIGSFSLAVDPDTLFLGEPAIANIAISVKDTAGAPIAGMSTSLTASSGLLRDIAGVTDDQGMVTTTLSLDHPENNIIVSAGISKVRDLTAIRTIIVAGAHPHPFGVAIASDVEFVMAGEQESRARLTATLTDRDGNPVEGERVAFETNMGVIFAASPITDAEGQASAYFGTVGDHSLDSLLTEATAIVSAKYGSESADAVAITIRPVIAHIWDMTIACPPPYEYVTVRIANQYDMPCRAGELVSFTMRDGDITPSALTDSNGVAVARLTPGVSSEPIVITARWGELERSITIPPNDRYPNSFSILDDGSLLTPSGAGGDSTIEFTIEVFDQVGEPFLSPIPIVMEVLEAIPPPFGPHWPSGNAIDSTVSDQGRATIALTSGRLMGSLLIKAKSWRDWDEEHAGDDHWARSDSISVVLAVVPIVAGPPTSIELDIQQRAEDAGGGNWQLPMSAKLMDLYRNPVADGLEVNFTFDPPVVFAETAVTGNNIGEGATPGFAYSWLFYHSFNTGEQIRVKAEVEVSAGEFLSTEQDFVLPLQEGFLTLTADPQNWEFDPDQPNDTCLIEITAVLTDGHGVAINNMPVLFRSDRAQFYWRNGRLNGRFMPFFPEVPRKYTGVVNEEMNEPRGTATVYLRGVMNDIFLDAFEHQAEVHLEAYIEGYEVAADPVSVNFTRP